MADNPVPFVGPDATMTQTSARTTIPYYDCPKCGEGVNMLIRWRRGLVFGKPVEGCLFCYDRWYGPGFWNVRRRLSGRRWWAWWICALRREHGPWEDLDVEDDHVFLSRCRICDMHVW